MFKVNNIRFTDSGKKINYDYTYDKVISRFFNKKERFYSSYNIDVSNVPDSIAVIPLLVNIMPISWFAGFDVFVDELDKEFLQSLEQIKKEFVKNHPEIKPLESKLIVNKEIKNVYEVNQVAMLFSGGVDAYTTFFRHYDKKPHLITIHGADVEIEDIEQWQRVIQINKEEPVLKNNKKHYIESNVRTFYTHQVDLLLPNLGWWGKVQHGLSLNGLVAPLSYVEGYQENYIASSYTDNIKIAWGSTPEIDNSIKWGNTRVIHDGYELKRQDKIDFIVNFIRDSKGFVNLRVCYSLLNESVNCGKCEKCLRTIIAIILNNESPNRFGFETDERVYSQIIKTFEKGIESKGTKYFWWEISEKIKNTSSIYIFKDEKKEKEKLRELNGIITQKLTEVVGSKKREFVSRLKFRLRRKFPKTFNYYLKLRQRKI